MELVHYCCVLYMFVVCPAIGLLMVYLTAPDHVNFMSSAYWRNKRRENAMRDAERREHEDYMKEIRERRAREKLRQPTESIEVNTEGSTQLNSDKHSDGQSETTSMPHETIINNKTTTAECSMITDSNTEEMDKSILSVDKSQQTTPRKKVTDQFTNTVRPRTKRCKKRKRYHHAYGVELQPIVVVVVLNENSTDTGRVKTSVDVGSQGDKWTGEEMETEVYSTFNHPTVDVLPQGTVPPFSDQTPKQENDVIPASNSRSSTDMKEASFSSSSGTLYSASTSISVDPCNEKTTPAGPIDNNSADLNEFDMAYKRMKEKLAGFSKMVKDM